MAKSQIDAATARRIALRAQGFASTTAGGAGSRALTTLAGRLGLIQIDSVNVLIRSHYLPVYSRLGHYQQSGLDALVYGPGPRRLFEYWGHEASLIPMDFHPLLRWRMARAVSGQGLWGGPAKFARDNPGFIKQALSELRARGPLSASELSGGGKASGKWWGWSDGKRAMEYLFWTGEVTTSARRGTFERVYDLSERVIPSRIINLPTPSETDAQRELVRLAARAMGIATAQDLRDYFRLPLADARARIAELQEAGDLIPTTVEGWKHPAFLLRDATQPRHGPDCAALLSPFDNLIWERDRTERLFGVRVKLEIYTPAAQRQHGYYVLPFLLGDTIAARVDLKADRQAGVLAAPAVHLEPGAILSDTAPALAAALTAMAGWLGLRDVRVGGATAFAKAVAKAV